MTRRAAAILLAGAAWLLAAAPAAADNGPHVEGQSAITDSCAGCHRTHTAPAPHLLKESQTSLCFTCHGTAGTGSNLDVEGGVGYSEGEREGTTGGLRGGGFSYALIGSGSPSGNGYLGEIPVLGSGEPVTSSHSVDESKVTAWGYGSISGTAEYGKTIKLSCGNCHDPHGNGNYRVLRTTPTELVEWPETGPEVAIADTEEEVYTTSNYWRVEDPNAPGFIANISAWCSTCHTRYLSGAEGGSTDSGDAVYAYRHRSDQTAQGSASCVQCHVAHGSNASMGTYSSEVTEPDGTATGSDSRLLRIDNRGICQMCHSK